jgi:hypothetical protein
MFGVADLITCAVIKQRLEFLSKNPSHLEFILSPFWCNKSLRDLVGAEHIKNCVDFVINNKITVAPYYEIDLKKSPSISIVSSGVEEIQTLGDYGDNVFNQTVKPIEYLNFDATLINADEIHVSKEYNLERKLWNGVTLTNGTESRILKGMKVGGETDMSTVLYLDTDLPTGTDMKGWLAQSSSVDKRYILSTSIDKVSVQIKLTTMGDYSIHRLLNIVLRYCLKKGRMDFENAGMQVPTFSYSPPILTEGESDIVFESVCTIEAKMPEYWIDHEFTSPDSSAKLDITEIAVSDNKNNAEVKVYPNE